MTIHTSHIDYINRLDLIFEGNLDLSIEQTVCDICKRVPSGIRSCILDLRGVECVFDSGVELLHMLHQRLTELGIPVVILSDSPLIRKRIPFITGEHWRNELLGLLEPDGKSGDGEFRVESESRRPASVDPAYETAPSKNLGR